MRRGRRRAACWRRVSLGATCESVESRQGRDGRCEETPRVVMYCPLGAAPRCTCVRHSVHPVAPSPPDSALAPGPRTLDGVAMPGTRVRVSWRHVVAVPEPRTGCDDA